MALLISPPAFTHCTTNLSGTPSSAGSNGTLVTAGTSNAEGSKTSVISAITHDVELLEILIFGTATAAAVNRVLMNVYTDPAGGTSWGTDPLIPNFVCGGAPGSGAGAVPNVRLLFPIWIKSGSSIGLSFRAAHTVAPTTRAYVIAYGGHTQPSQWWCGQRVTDIGTSTAASSGTSHTAGNSGAYSSWTNFGSTTAAAAGAVVWAVQPQLATHTALGYYFEFGVGSTRIGPNLALSTNTSEQMLFFSNNRMVFSSIPSGTQLQVRATCSGTAEALDVAAYIIS